MFSPPTRTSRPTYTAPTRPPARSRSGRQDQGSTDRFKQFVAVGGALTLLLVGFIVWKIRPETPPPGAIAVVVNTDSNSAGNGIEQARPLIVEKALALAASGGGTLYVLGGDGTQSRTIAQMDLGVTGPDGHPEPDLDVRRAVISARLEEPLTTATTFLPLTQGRPVLPLIIAVAQLRAATQGPFSLTYVGFGLSDQDPSAIQHQIRGMSPEQAVASLDDLPDLSGTEITLVFTAAAGEQLILNDASRAWRLGWWRAIASATGARLGTVQDDNLPADPAMGAPGASPIPLIDVGTEHGTSTAPTPTPVVVTPPTPTVTGPQITATVTPTVTISLPPPPPVTISGATFVEDEPIWLHEDAAKEALQSLVDAWRSAPDGAYAPLVCTGRTAAYGPREGAIVLSTQRAALALALAHSMGIRDVAAPIGVGFDDPLTGFGPQDAAQRSVTCVLTPL